MNRRSFLKQTCLGSVALTLAAPGFAKSKSRKPDIVLIMADDIGISDIGCYGGEIETPNIDALAAGGVKFRNFYCEPMCVPARATTLTGIYENNSLKKPGGLNKATLSIAEVLRGNGYATAMSGKWHLGTGDNIPYYRGFDRFYGTTDGCGSFFAPLSLMRDDKNAENEFMDKDYYYTDAITDNAIDYVKETSKDQPLLLYVAYTAAHWPLHAKPEDIEKYKGKYSMGWDELRNKRFKRMKELGVIDRRAKLSPRDPDVPAWEEVGDKEWQERRMEVYAAQIDSMDQNIGRLVNCLKKSGRGDNAIVMFMIDNGGCHVEYETTRTGSFLNKTTRDGRPLVPGNIPGLMPGPEVTFQSYGRGWANASNTPYRLFKQYAHQGGIRNPLIIRWPDGIKKQLTGSFTDTTACMIDIMPTLLDVTETEHPAEKNKKYLPMDGKSFLGALYGKGLAERGAMLFKWAHGKAVVDGKWKIVIVDNGDWELYDLESDASELNDLASKHPGKVEQMEKLWIGQYGEVKPDKKNKSKEKEKK